MSKDTMPKCPECSSRNFVNHHVNADAPEGERHYFCIACQEGFFAKAPKKPEDREAPKDGPTSFVHHVVYQRGEYDRLSFVEVWDKDSPEENDSQHFTLSIDDGNGCHLFVFTNAGQARAFFQDAMECLDAKEEP